MKLHPCKSDFTEMYQLYKECASANLETGRLPASPAKLGATVRAVIDKGASVPNSKAADERAM